MTTNYERGESTASQIAYYNARAGGRASWFEITIPYSLRLSKNQLYGRKRKGGVYLAGESRRAMEEIERAAKLAFEPDAWYPTKIWIEIHVYRPNDRADAINFVDAVADALQKATGVNDKWFAIHRVDWTMDKDNPRIEIRVWADTEAPRMICSMCCRVLGYEHYFLRDGKPYLKRCKLCHKKAMAESKRSKKKRLHKEAA